MDGVFFRLFAGVLMTTKYAIQVPDIEFWKNLVPCQIGCPIHTDAGRYVQLIAEGRYEEAYLTSRSPNPFASVCGRVCAAPCEDVCRRGKIDAPVTIRALKRFVTDKYGVESVEPDTQDKLFAGATEPGNKWQWHLPQQFKVRKGVVRDRKVAVVGSGPSGLSCAHDLALMGYRVTVFEATDVGGEMLRRSRVRSRATAQLRPADTDFHRFGQDDQPVTWVTWFEANAFCKWMTGRFGAGKWQFSLPTDAEWEKGARGPENLDYALSMVISDAEMKLYNWGKNPASPITVFGVRSTTELFAPNHFGLYHMTGNVAEWTQSITRPFNRDHPWVDDDRNHDETPGLRSVRGGSWYSAAISYISTAYRDSFQPEHCTQDIGSRVVARALP